MTRFRNMNFDNNVCILHNSYENKVMVYIPGDLQILSIQITDLTVNASKAAGKIYYKHRPLATITIFRIQLQITPSGTLHCK